jgi:hypothetical protein
VVAHEFMIRVFHLGLYSWLEFWDSCVVACLVYFPSSKILVSRWKSNLSAMHFAYEKRLVLLGLLSIKLLLFIEC